MLGPTIIKEILILELIKLTKQSLLHATNAMNEGIIKVTVPRKSMDFATVQLNYHPHFRDILIMVMLMIRL